MWEKANLLPQSCEDVLAALALVVVLALIRLTIGIFTAVFVYFVRQPVNPRSYGAWAVVTGASDGIGKAYAHLLAEKGRLSMDIGQCLVIG